MDKIKEYVYIIRDLTKVKENTKEYQELKRQQQELRKYILSK